MVIIKGSCLIPSNAVEANVDGHKRHCSNQFCIDQNYEKLELPPPNPSYQKPYLTQSLTK